MAEVARSPLVDIVPAAPIRRRWFRRRPEAVVPKPMPVPRSKPAWRRDDVMVAALGLTLGLICALFPWYIFLNPDQFGPPSIPFDASGGGSGVARPGAGGQGRLGSGLVSSMADERFDPEALDLLATGTTPDAAEPPPTDDAQPFPSEPVAFHLLYVANGRAMMEDDTGVFVVAPGDRLPDNSRVSRIEERGGRWVVMTSADAVLEAR